MYLNTPNSRTKDFLTLLGNSLSHLASFPVKLQDQADNFKNTHERKTIRGSCPDQHVHHAINTGATASQRRLKLVANREKSSEAKTYMEEMKFQFTQKDLMAPYSRAYHSAWNIDCAQ